MMENLSDRDGWIWMNGELTLWREAKVHALTHTLLDGRVIGNGQRGPLTEQLQSVYFDQVRGRRDAFPDWLVPVSGS
jgi:branched-subunit amino acid aminotransferase/4-amino-4-deoxychorismate lyase